MVTVPAVAPGATAPEAERLDGVVLPGLPNLHSHAFQRAMAGLAERSGPGTDSFWTWRETMYRFASRLTPADIEAIAAQLYAEMLQAGYTAVAVASGEAETKFQSGFLLASYDLDDWRLSVREDLFQMRDAIGKYYGDKGKYPDTLEALAAESYLRKIPVDPITDSASLKRRWYSSVCPRMTSVRARPRSSPSAANVDCA